MIRLAGQLGALLFLTAIQVSFINALPYPFDRIPLVLVVTTYLYQYRSYTTLWWWLPLYGSILDVLGISTAPFEVISYTLAAGCLTILVAHVFTNRSFYGIVATSWLCLAVLTLSEIVLLGLSQLFSDGFLPWKNLVMTNLWSGAFAAILLLFVAPFFRRSIGRRS
ncbi:hypothetical protein HY733_02850 [Candidatus Uhrbacteria bacterium]|nr:hypothetical protein [Candidatus Uhrbacteria bacterium]